MGSSPGKRYKDPFSFAFYFRLSFFFFLFFGFPLIRVFDQFAAWINSYENETNTAAVTSFYKIIPNMSVMSSTDLSVCTKSGHFYLDPY